MTKTKQVDIREGNYLHLLRRQIERKTFSNLEADLAKTNKTMLVNITEDYEVISFKWQEQEMQVIQEEEVQPETKQEEKAENKCRYCPKPALTLRHATCGSEVCERKLTLQKYENSRVKNAADRYKARLAVNNFSLSTLKIEAVTHINSLHQCINKQHKELLAHYEKVKKSYHYILVPQTLHNYSPDSFAPNSTIFMKYKGGSAITNARRFKGLNLISTQKEVLRFLRDVKGQNLRVLVLFDAKTMLFAQYLAQNITLLPLESVKKGEDFNDKFLGFFDETITNYYKRRGL